MLHFIENINEGAKVALGLVISEGMIKFLDTNHEGYEICKEALDHCWKWLEGEGILADDLTDYIDSREYKDVSEYASDAIDLKDKYIWYVVLYAVSYTAWQAYNKEQEDCPPAILDNVDDELLLALAENAFKSGNLSIESIENVKKYLLENHSMSNEYESGSITREKVMSLVDY